MASEHMRKILVVDDLRYFGEFYDGLPVEYARTSAAALEALKNWQTYEQIFLDHDLGENDDARVVGHFLEELSFAEPDACQIGVLILSDNPVGRKELAAATRRYVRLHTLPRSQHALDR